MKIVNINLNPNFYWHNGQSESSEAAVNAFRALVSNSAPKNIARGLIRRGLISGFEEWRAWGFPTLKSRAHDLPLVFFESRDGVAMPDLANYLAREGTPDIIWAEGIKRPAIVDSVFTLCPDAMRIVYSKYCEPWLIEDVNSFDLCLVDEEWQVQEMANRCPAVACRVWDKLIDYDREFFPMAVQKQYDICYVARLHPRKNHWLLFDALAKLQDRRLKVVLVGYDQNRCQRHLEKMAREAGVTAVFTGNQPPHRVNELINQSRLGVICDPYDAVPRAMLETMAADVPVLVNSDMRAGTRYVGPRAGLVFRPEEFSESIAHALDHLSAFRPREHLLECYDEDLVVAKFWAILRDGFDSAQHN